MTVNKARVVSELLGFGGGDGQLHKLTIYYERFNLPQGKVEALFNPAEITLTKTARWEQEQAVGQGGSSGNQVDQEFRSVDAETFSIELFFDTYEPRPDTLSAAQVAASFLPASLIPGRMSTDVRQHTDQIAQLVEVNPDLHQPPVCDLRWGVFDIFTGVLTMLNQRFTLFLDDGTPVRATLTCEFTEVGSLGKARAAEMHSSDVIKVRQVQRYDTLQSVAADEYGDPARWRPIATANGIVNPRALVPGTTLTIPKLTTPNSAGPKPGP
jgi:nucleoid-associated protein YgaU